MFKVSIKRPHAEPTMHIAQDMEDVKRYVKAYASVATLPLGTTLWIKDLTSGTVNVYALSGGGEDRLIASDIDNPSTMEF